MNTSSNVQIAASADCVVKVVAPCQVVTNENLIFWYWSFSESVGNWSLLLGWNNFYNVKSFLESGSSNIDWWSVFIATGFECIFGDLLVNFTLDPTVIWKNLILSLNKLLQYDAYSFLFHLIVPQPTKIKCYSQLTVTCLYFVYFFVSLKESWLIYLFLETEFPSDKISLCAWFVTFELASVWTKRPDTELKFKGHMSVRRFRSLRPEMSIVIQPQPIRSNQPHILNISHDKYLNPHHSKELKKNLNPDNEW